MISEKIGQAAQAILGSIVRSLSRLRIRPNHLTFMGFLASILAAFSFARGNFRLAGVVLIVAGLFDMVDGMVARKTHAETPFGAFFDSVMDRYSDLIMYIGLLIYFANLGRNNYVVLVAVCMMGSVLISYSRARAESIIPSCKVGFLERPERMVLLIIGSFYRMEPVLWVIGVLSNWTVVHRIIHTRSTIRAMEEKTDSAQQEAQSRETSGNLSNPNPLVS